jgi:RNA polymerase sigma factor FliA
VVIATRDGYGSRSRVEEAPKALWEGYKANPSEAVRNQLIEHYLPIVRYTAERLATKLPQSVDIGDLMSAGVFGLMDAIDGFDMTREVKFKTYCTLRIRGAILDYLRQCDWVPRLVRTKANQLEAALHQLEVKLGHQPSDIELSQHLGLSLKQFDTMVKDATATQVVSLSDTWHDDDGGKSIQTIDIVANSKEPDPADKIQATDFMELVSRELDMKERLIVMLYYFEELTMREIGVILDLSESRVCQLHSRIKKRLSTRLAGRASEFLD